MKEQSTMNEFPLVTYEFKDVLREKLYSDIKRNIMDYCGENGKEFPSQYNWIFNLVIKVNHRHFGKNKVNILVGNYNERDETSNLYGLIKSFITIFNFCKNSLEFRAIEEVKQFIDKDKKRYEQKYNDIITEYSNEKNYKSKLRIDLINQFESDEKYEKDFFDIYESVEDGLEIQFNSIRATSYFRGEVFLRFYKELNDRLFNTEPINTSQNNITASKASIATNQQEISKSSNVSISTNSTPKGFNLVGYSVEQLTSLHKALIDKKYLKDNAPLKHFINAFNGKELEDFEPLKWKSKTMGAIFINYFLRKSETHWKDTQHILEPANYKQLLSQILKKNKFQDCTNELNIIEKQIKLLTIIDSQ